MIRTRRFDEEETQDIGTQEGTVITRSNTTYYMEKRVGNIETSDIYN